MKNEILRLLQAKVDAVKTHKELSNVIGTFSKAHLLSLEVPSFKTFKNADTAATTMATVLYAYSKAYSPADTHDLDIIKVRMVSALAEVINAVPKRERK